MREAVKRDVDLVVLAGYMKIVTPGFCEAYRHRIINIHPALLPSFPGLHVQQRAIDHGVRFSGCTTHFVAPEVDAGPIILQACVPVLPDDTEDALAARILTEEHKIYPETVRLYFQGRLEVRGRRVVILPTRALIFDERSPAYDRSRPQPPAPAGACGACGPSR